MSEFNKNVYDNEDLEPVYYEGYVKGYDYGKEQTEQKLIEEFLKDLKKLHVLNKLEYIEKWQKRLKEK